MASLSRGLKSILLCLSLFITVSSLSSAQSNIVAEGGVMDLRQIQLNKNPLPLNGYWDFYESQLLTPADYKDGKSKLVNFPGVWNKKSSFNAATGYGTYHLTVLINSKEYRTINIDMPEVYNSYQLWVNDQVIASNGIVGATQETSKPQWFSQVITLDSRTDTLDLILQISNFHHHTGGIKEPIFLGADDLLLQRHNITIASNMTEAICLILLSITFLVFYFQRERKKIIVYFSLMCLTWAVRSVFSNQYLLISFLPDFNWNVMVRIEYITIYLSIIWAILFISRLFSNERSQIIKYFLSTCNILFTVFTILTPPIQFTQWLTVYLIFAGFMIVYAMYVVIKALINERTGAPMLSVSILLAIFIFSYDIFTFEGLFTYNAIVFGVGYVTMFFLLGIALLQSLDIIKGKPKQTTLLRFEDFYNKDN